MQPLVSILIPAYNAEPWIGESIDSALAQSWPRTEIIVVDDGSRDETLRVARRKECKRVKVLSQDNAGACAARNRALGLAQGDYIQWLDADDLLAPGKIAANLTTCTDPDILLTSAWARFYHRVERAAPVADAMWKDFEPIEWYLAKLVHGVWMNPGAWLVSRQLTERAGPWDIRLGVSGDDDGEYMCRLVAASRGVRFSREAMAYYRIGNGGLSGRKSDAALDAFFLATSLCVGHLRSLEDSPRTRAACLHFLQNRLTYFHPAKPEIVHAAEQLALELGGSLQLPAGSARFNLARRFLGLEVAARLKHLLWVSQVRCAKNVDLTLGVLADMRRHLPFRGDGPTAGWGA